MALGLALILGVMHIWNFAHGQFLILSGYIILWMFAMLGEGVNPFVLSPIAIIFIFMIGVIVYRFLLNPLAKYGARQFILASILICLGLAVVLESSTIIMWGTMYRGIPYSITPASIMGFPTMRLIGLIIALILVTLLQIVLSRTYFGKALRAIIQDREAAASLGINVDKISLITFGIGSALAGVAGVIVGITYFLNPVMGMTYTFKALVIVALGGLGTVTGILFAGLLLGIAESFTGYFIGTAYTDTIALLLLVVALGSGLSKVR
jgi:branched-chain amino acid transport system permease protein